MRMKKIVAAAFAAVAVGFAVPSAGQASSMPTGRDMAAVDLPCGRSAEQVGVTWRIYWKNCWVDTAYVAPLWDNQQGDLWVHVRQCQGVERNDYAVWEITPDERPPAAYTYVVNCIFSES